MALSFPIWTLDSLLLIILLFPQEMANICSWRVFSACFLLIRSWRLSSLFSFWTMAVIFRPSLQCFHWYNSLKNFVGFLCIWLKFTPVETAFFFLSCLLSLFSPLPPPLSFGPLRVLKAVLSGWEGLLVPLKSLRSLNKGSYSQITDLIFSLRSHFILRIFNLLGRWETVLFPDPYKSWTFSTCLKSVYKPNLSLFSSYFTSHILSYAARRRQLTFCGFDILSKYLLDRSTFISTLSIFQATRGNRFANCSTPT